MLYQISHGNRLVLSGSRFSGSQRYNAAAQCGYNFEPKALATRAEVAQVLSAFLPLDAPPAASNFFNDINGIPEREAILKVANTGWVSGYEDGSFRPYNNITRAELITVINNLLYRTIKAPVQDLTFKDVQPYQWFYNSIATAMFGNI